MQVATMKIVAQIVSQMGLAEHIYLPLNKKLGTLNGYDFMQDDKLFEMLNERHLDRRVADLHIYGVATPEDSKVFLHMVQGKRIMEYIIENSTAKDRVEPIEEIIAKYYGEY